MDDGCARRLAEALVEFDALLALDVLDHLQARANEWDDSKVDRPVAPGRNEQARRYRGLAEMIESLSRVRIVRHYY